GALASPRCRHPSPRQGPGTPNAVVPRRVDDVIGPCHVRFRNQLVRRRWTTGQHRRAHGLRRRRRARRDARADPCAPAPLPSGVPAPPRTRPGGPPRTLPPHSPTPAAAGTSKGPRMSTRPPTSRRARAALAITALLAGTALTALPAGTASAA